MIKLTDKDKTLVIPSGLGNLGQSSGSGSGITPEEAAQIASAVTAEAIDEYDTELQVDLEDIRDAVSGNSEDISTLSGSVETLSTSLSAYTTNDTFNAGISGLTEQISGLTSDLSSVTYTLSEQISGVSADVEEVSGKTQEVYDEIFYEKEGETYSRIADLEDNKQDVLEAGSGISIDNNTVSVNIGPGLTLDNKGYNQVMAKLGEGLHFASGDTIGVKIGDGLGFSGDTLVVSGATGGGPAVYVVNLLTEQERIALYNELMAYRYTTSYIGVQSGFPASDYAFYYWAGDDTSDEFNGDFRGFVPLQLAALHPGDYGGAVFFSGMVLSRNGGGLIRTIKYVITSDGSVDMARGTNNWDPHPEASYIYVDSGGTFSNDLWSLGNITNGDIIYRLNVRYNNNDYYSLGPVTEYRKNTEEVATDDWRNVYYFSTVISINGTTYKGTWRLVDYGDWEGHGPYPATSWTTV